MSIFVECQHTVADLFAKAKNPNKITVGICWQFDGADDTACFEVPAPFPEQVRIHKMDYREARGPCLARSLTQALWQGEEYYLQIDSHMRFARDWDVKLLGWLAACPDPARSILSSYPVSFDRGQTPSERKPTVLAFKNFPPDHIPRFKVGPVKFYFSQSQGRLLTQSLPRPIPSKFWCAGFSFSSSAFLQQVPYDASLDYLFFGEEISVAVRAWTLGWDFFAPGETLIYHLYSRAYRPTFQQYFGDKLEQLQEPALERVRALLRDGPSGETVRSLTDYEAFCGLRFSDCTVVDPAKAVDISQPAALFLDNLLGRLGLPVDI